MKLSGCKLVSLSVAFGVTALSGAAARAQAPTVKVDGSSTVFPVAEAVAEEFQKAKKGAIKVTVGIAGTGGGFKKFARGETDVSNASRPISKEEMKACKEAGIEYIELPICFDALTVAVNPKNDWVSTITVDELKKIWEPAPKDKAHPVTHWNHVRAEWPAEKIALFGAGSDSGTFDYFTEAVCGKAKASRGDFTASEDDNVLVQGIEGNKYALGYIPFAYYEPRKDKMKALAIEWPKNSVKTAVLPSMENVLKGVYNPLSRPLFMYVNKKSADKPEVKEYVEFFLKEGAALAQEVKYLPLPAAAYVTGLKRFTDRQIGTGFGGVPEVGVTIEELLKRTPVTEAKAEAAPASAPKK
ncbi:MAG: PstS family phosphate ABC transporter substrate-binding protein [Planctomycetota bacterium]|nr:PstS family phosphate ABC transporter substrate-binding protein [Planctomycetota bacterium]